MKKKNQNFLNNNGKMNVKRLIFLSLNTFAEEISVSVFYHLRLCKKKNTRLYSYNMNIKYLLFTQQ